MAGERAEANVRKLASAALTYVLSFGINNALPFFLLPLLTRYLTPADYGRVAMFQVLVAVATPVVGLSLYGAVQRFYFDAEDEGKDSGRLSAYVSGSIALITLAGTIAALIAWAGMRWIQPLVDIPPAWIFAALACTAGTSMFQLQLAIFNAQMRPMLYAMLTNAQTGVNVALTLALVILVGWGWEGRATAIVIAALLAGATALLLLKRDGHIWTPPRAPLMSHALLFVLPLLPHSIAQALRASFDRTFMNVIGDLEQTGLFAVALALASLIAILGQALSQAWVPWLFKSLKAQYPSKQKIVALSYAIIAGLIAAGALFIWLGPWLFDWFIGPRFAGATSYFRWLAAAATCIGVYYIVAPYIPYVGRNIYSSYTSMASLGVGIVAAIGLGTLYGPIGVARASFVTALFELAATLYFANRCVPMPWLGLLSHRHRPRADMTGRE